MAAACADRTTQPPEAIALPLSPQSVVSCPTPGALGNLVEAVLSSGSNRTTALTQLAQVVQLAGQEFPNIPAARTQAFALLTFLLDKYRAGSLIGGQSAQTQATLQQLLNGILCVVGLQPAFGTGSLGNDGAAAFIYPSTADTTVVTQTQWAGMKVPAGSVTEPTVVTVQRLPDSPGPLITPLDQYPLFYEFHSSSGTPFIHDLTVAVCQAANITAPDPTRLRVAHNVGGVAVITPLAPVTFLDCSNAPLASAPSTWGFDLARAGNALRRGIGSVLLPQRLLAAPMFATGGVGGTVKEFSPFGTVDTLGSITNSSVIEVHGLPNGPANVSPAVIIRTPTGRPMVGIPVTFVLTSGGGSLAGGSTVTNANGIATAGVWTMGPVKGCSRALATATMPPGSGLTRNPILFYGCARIP